jgi:hypothetical protein
MPESQALAARRTGAPLCPGCDGQLEPGGLFDARCPRCLADVTAESVSWLQGLFDWALVHGWGTEAVRRIRRLYVELSGGRVLPGDPAPSGSQLASSSAP